MKFYTNSLQSLHDPTNGMEIPSRITDILAFLNDKKLLTSVPTMNYEVLLSKLPEMDTNYIKQLMKKIKETNHGNCRVCNRWNYIYEHPQQRQLCEQCKTDLTDPKTRYGYVDAIYQDTSCDTETYNVLCNMLSCLQQALVDNIVESSVYNTKDFMMVTRPPGHHSSANIASGFCYINWVYLISRYLYTNVTDANVCILDLDLHHGNGTELMVKNKPNTLFIDFHYYAKGFYPGTGKEGKFIASNVYNINMKKKSRDEHYLDRLTVEMDKIRIFNPTIFIISMGCDIVDGDNFDIMRCSTEFYKKVYDMLKAEFDLPIILVLEGGYNKDNVTGTIKNFV